MESISQKVNTEDKGNILRVTGASNSRYSPRRTLIYPPKNPPLQPRLPCYNIDQLFCDNFSVASGNLRNGQGTLGSQFFTGFGLPDVKLIGNESVAVLAGGAQSNRSEGDRSEGDEVWGPAKPGR
ncbi:MAG: hypothetical protein A2W33_03930 [Chloroflexi bacterium RBG_16_52_11]|nr:MAG: hypothetical protein A2W33_03930 [Chloroflexi bacterium RBG_16_52_11]